jgi:ABC-type branched-subunit amino acid transport system ATPase component/ABC-type branched-subunit amino acid transport system permease subunit
MAVIFILPLVLGGSWVGLVGLGLAFGVAFLGYTLVAGEGGMIWLCLISFAGLGAIFTAQFSSVFGLPSLLALLLGAATAIPLGLLIGLIALRIGSLYLALITLTVGLLMDNLIFSMNRFVNFGAGVYLNRPSFAHTDRAFTYFVFVVFCIVAVIVWNIRNSTTGLAMSAVRGSAAGAETVGISIFRMRVFISVIGSFVAALGGGLIAMFGQAALPSSFAALGGLVWLAVLVTTGVRSNVAAAVAGLTFSLLPAVFTRYLPTGISPLPTAMFGIGAIMVVHNPDGALAMNARQLQGVISRALGMLRRNAAQPGTAEEAVSSAAAADAVVTALPLTADDHVLTSVPVAISNGQAPAAGTHIAGPAASAAAAERDVVLAASGVGVRFGGVTALSDVSLEVRAGQIVGLVGPNGAGKSTLFAVISGFLRDHAGSVNLNGKDVTGLTPERRARLGLARTFQQPELFTTLTVRQHLVLADRIRHSYGRLFRDAVDVRGTRHGSREENGRVTALLEMLGLEGIADRLAAGLPTGLSRLVEIGRALATDPTVVLLDEPTAGLDPQESARLGQALRQIADQRQTSLLLVEHDLDHVLTVSDYIYVLDFGELIAAGNPSAIRTDALVRSAYMGTEPLTGLSAQ